MAVPPPTQQLLAFVAGATGDAVAQPLAAGDVIAARVSANLTGDLARLLFRGGALDVRLPQPLPPGTQVTFEVKEGGTSPRIVILEARPPQPSPQPAQPPQPASPAVIRPPAAQAQPAQPAATQSAPATPAPGAVSGAAVATTQPNAAAPPPAGAAPSPTTGSTPGVPQSSATHAGAAPASTGPVSTGPVSAAPASTARPGAAAPSQAPAAPLTGRVEEAAARPAPPPVAPAPASGVNRDPLRTALADSAARQSGFAALFADAELALQTTTIRSALPEPVAQAIARLIGFRLEGESPDPKALHRAVLRSGVFAEAELHAGRPPTGDFKPAVLALRQALTQWLGRDAGSHPHETKPAPPQRGGQLAGERPVAPAPADSAEELGQRLLTRADGALHRVRLLQMASLPDRAADSHADRPPTVVELPLALPGGTGTVQLSIQRDGKGKSDARQRGWRVRFSLDPGEAGPTHAGVDLDASDAVSVSLYAENEAMAALLEAHADELRAGLEAAGVETRAITARKGRPRAAETRAGFFLDRLS